MNLKFTYNREEHIWGNNRFPLFDIIGTAVPAGGTVAIMGGLMGGSGYKSKSGRETVYTHTASAYSSVRVRVVHGGGGGDWYDPRYR